MLIRQLDPNADFAITRELHDRAADDLMLEHDRCVDTEMVIDFFNAAPPGIDRDTSLRVGLFTGQALAAIAELSFGYPDKGDAYIGLLLVAADQRGHAIGRHLLSYIESRARNRGARCLLLAVLQDNPRGHAFWTRRGFSETQHRALRQTGERTHILIRMSSLL